MANTLNTVNLPQNSTSGQLLTTSGFNGSSWTSATTSVNPVLTIPADGASLEVKGKMVVNGRDLEERLNTIEKVLQIPERDVKLEKKYPKLKKMYEEYIKELSKARMWESLKGEDND
jgi:hypothetical protein